MKPNHLSVDKTKKESQHDVEFAEGGDTKMFGEQQADPDKPGSTGKPDVSGPGAKFAEGGKTKMHGYSPSVAATAGITGAR